MNAVHYLFYSKGQSRELRKRLDEYKDNLLAIDDVIDTAFRSTLKSKKNENYFSNIPAIAALAELNDIKYVARIIENRMITFCCNRITGCVLDFDSYSAIIGQSSNIVQAGEIVEINAGMGEFNTSREPEIIINGQIVPLEQGLATYKFKASGKPGKYIVPVKIRYTGKRGRDEIEKKVEYTIAGGNQPKTGQ